MDLRRKNMSWRVPRENGSVFTDDAQLAVLMDIRDELQAINKRVQCQDTLLIPTLLKQIRRNTTKKRRRKK
jgi:hypothetical protein